MLGVVAMQVSRLAVAILLARLLTPHEYGLAAMALVFTTLVLIVSDLSLGAALIQRKQITEADRSTVFWMSLAIGLLFTLAGVALAGPIAAFYGEPQVRTLFVALSLTFVLTSLQVTQASLLQREMDFRALTGRRTAAVILGGVAGVTLAALDYGPWALVGQQIVVSLVSTALLWTFSPWRPRWTFSWASLRDLGGFGLNLFGARLVNYFSRNADSLLIGRVLGSAALGVYAVAYNVVLTPVSRLVTPLQDVLFPAYSRLQDQRGRLAAAWLRVNEFTCAVLAPALVGLIVVAPDFVPVVLGDQWRGGVRVVQVLAGVALIQALGASGTKIFEALGRPGTVFRMTFVEFAALIPALVVGLQWGVVGVAAAYAAVTAPLTFVFIWLTTRTLELPVARLVEALGGVFQAAAVMGIVVWLTREGLVASDMTAGYRLPLLIVVGGAVYLPLCLWRAPGVREEASRAVLRRRVRPATAAADR